MTLPPWGSLYFLGEICYAYHKGGVAMKLKKLTALAILTALALILFIIEAQIPPLVPIPGVQLGIANVVTVFCVFAFGSKEAAAVLCCRVFLGSVFAGNFSTILYSGAGGLCAIAVTIAVIGFAVGFSRW